MILTDGVKFDPTIFEWGFDPITIEKLHQRTKSHKYTYNQVTAVKETNHSYIVKLYLDTGRRVTLEINKEKLRKQSRDYKLSKLLGG